MQTFPIIDIPRSFMSQSQRKFRVREVIGWWCCLSSGVRLGISVSVGSVNHVNIICFGGLCRDYCHLSLDLSCILSCARMCSSGGFRYRGW